MSRLDCGGLEGPPFALAMVRAQFSCARPRCWEGSGELDLNRGSGRRVHLGENPGVRHRAHTRARPSPKKIENDGAGVAGLRVVEVQVVGVRASATHLRSQHSQCERRSFR